MSSGANINVNDDSFLKRNNKFVATFAFCRSDVNRVDRMPDIDSAIRKFNGFESHNAPLSFLVDLKRKSTQLFRPKVSEMRSRDFAVKQIENQPPSDHQLTAKRLHCGRNELRSERFCRESPVVVLSP